MPLVLVSENVLFSDMLRGVCLARGIEVAEPVRSIRDIDQVPENLTVILHARMGLSLDDLGIVEFKCRHPYVTVIAIASAGADAETHSALEEHVSFVLFDDTPSTLLVSLLTVVNEGLSISRDVLKNGRGGLVPQDRETPTQHGLGMRAVNATNAELATGDGEPTSTVAEPPRSRTARSLSPREIEILQLLMRGSSNKEIAKKLNLLENTVKVHLRSCYVKIGVHNRTQAAIWGANHMTVTRPNTLRTQ